MNVNTQIDRFDEFGYAVIENLLSTEEARALYDAFDAFPPASASGGPAKHNERVLLQDRRLFDAIVRPELLDVVRQVIGDDMQLIAFDSLDTPPRSGRDRNWHADIAFWTDSVLTANVAIYLQDMTAETGPLLVIPGSHERQRQPTKDEQFSELEGELPVELEAGSAVIFNAQIWHSGGRNDSDRPRRAIFPYFGHYWIKRMDEFYKRPLPQYILDNDDPLVRQLFGLGLTIESVHGVYDETTYG
jgi:ectoine hydroxylase-related dioxygenase (phytanoyl-CoA dioxygenase family)